MSKVKKILIKARREVLSEIIGNNPSPFKGEGYDFIELREYESGDDIRHIDWNITAKMQTPYIKVFREERELNVVVASMLNGSMHFGSKKFKQDVVAELVALLGYSAIKNSDMFSSYLFADKMYSFTRATKRESVLQKSVESIVEFEPINKKANYTLMHEYLYKSIKRKSLIILIGDFFEEVNFKLLSAKHEVLAIVVRDRLEESPPKFGFSSLLDLESGVNVEGDFNESSVKEYEKKVKEHDLKLFDRFRKQKIRYVKAYTDDSMAIKIRKLFGVM
ncbi:MAG: DUF58 domain-containing protein [Campylobacterota bacterium]|nr:DUF58 domain-containing protein [Campylobacterota bacterium]